VFDGRVTEDFKLSTGTWVNFSAVRASVIGACAPLIRDVVLTGLDLNYIGAMIFPDLEACARHAGLPPGTDPQAIVDHPSIRQKFAESLGGLTQKSTGSSNHVARAVLMCALPDIDKGEITDKGSINQRAVRTHRVDLVAALYSDEPGADVFILNRKGA
jgi:feruloyl-CoA synthase